MKKKGKYESLKTEFYYTQAFYYLGTFFNVLFIEFQNWKCIAYIIDTKLFTDFMIYTVINFFLFKREK